MKSYDSTVSIRGLVQLHCIFLSCVLCKWVFDFFGLSQQWNPQKLEQNNNESFNTCNFLRIQEQNYIDIVSIDNCKLVKLS